MSGTACCLVQRAMHGRCGSASHLLGRCGLQAAQAVGADSVVVGAGGARHQGHGLQQGADGPDRQVAQLQSRSAVRGLCVLPLAPRSCTLLVTAAKLLEHDNKWKTPVW